LVKAAEIFKETFRSSDIIARIGGDEFVVLAAIGPEESAEFLTNRLQEKFKATSSQWNHSYDLSVSVGLAHFDDDEGHSIEELMALADRAMYENKRHKRSRHNFTPEVISPRMEAVA